MASYRDAFSNLKQYDEYIGKITNQLYLEVNDTLKELMLDNQVGLREAQRKLNKEYEKALKSTNFIEKFTASTVKVIVESSYVANAPASSKKKWGAYLWNKSMFDDNVKLSTRIRSNSEDIVLAQKKVLRVSLKQGKTIAQIVGNIDQDTLKGFDRSLPKYLDDLRKASIAGEKISAKKISNIKRQVNRIKTGGLRADYNRLIEALELGKYVDKAVYFAMERRTKYYALRVARSETMRTMAVQRNHEAMKNPDAQYIKMVTQGSNPCPYCLAVEDLGFIPVANAVNPNFHSNCSCRAEYKYTIKRPKKWSNDTFKSRLQTNINKRNKQAESKGAPKTYQSPETPVNLRGAGDLLRDYSE